MLFDDKMKTYNSKGLLCEDYFCYRKPVLAPADGVIEEIVDHIDDNEIGTVNTVNNWGNTIIIRHLPGLFTQISHLEKGSFKVTKGAFVKRGDFLALCGNSGRSPEPHLHFQVQLTPMLGSKTIDYPFAYYWQKEKSNQQLCQFTKPSEGSLVSGLSSNAMLKRAFDIAPNTLLKYHYADVNGIEKHEQWETFTDAYNNKYLYCKATESSAFFVNDGLMFYFTAFYGKTNSLLYYFYLSAYKVFLGDMDINEMNDALPLHVARNKRLTRWLHDFVAPFYTYIRVWYSVKREGTNNILDADLLTLISKIQVSVFGKTETQSESTIVLKDNCIREFTFESGKIKIKAKWSDS